MEIGKAFVNLVFGNAFNKIGLSLILLIPGIGFLIIAASAKLKHPEILYVLGFLFILASLRLVLKRYSELKRNTKRQP
uniref:hypothetical protein n=1 Tax=Flavobacterium sp. TaxID=239 RepID=UPI00404B71D0